ncbi:hypothetical protein [Candidatus Phytoplasma citri]|uniref:Uncharacterized protein n=2 Tax=Candidatus Phytoplasma citri TaxID=180978 RepID=A0ABU8ZRA5_9MOLU|nr:hypothetical protein [Candidatus Phytoplasma aurantifolia]MDO8060291.1 hypothetical protein [Candidatus Phytoplasma aurantifolia]MDO8079046.1 hypothetical protein [Candidatus Phytoplasma aurantifolia]
MSIFYKIKKKYLKKIQKYAIKEHIPIIHEETGLFLENFVNQKKIINILEIGTAIGYSGAPKRPKFRAISPIARADKL